MLYRIYLFALLVTLFSLQFISCQKEPVDNTVATPIVVFTYDHLEGNFYCQTDHSYGYGSSNQSLSQSGSGDLVIATRVSNDTLYFHSPHLFSPLAFLIDSMNQTSFSIAPNPPQSYKQVSLEFYNNLDSIVLLDNTQGNAGGSNGYQNYYGTKTQLNVSSTPHAYINSLAGNYSLQVQKLRYQTGLDTQYTANLSVNQSIYKLEIDTSEFEMKVFHKTLNHRKYHIYNDIGIDQNYSIYWANDSLYFESKVIHLPNSSHGVDTIYYKFQGVKQ